MRILIFLLLSIPTFAQTLPVVSTHNYGTMESVSQLQSDFRFVNHGDKIVYVLIVKGGENITYKKPQGIAPGDTGILRIIYEPINAGVFNEDVQVFLSDNTKPTELHMKGIIKHIDNAMLHCATFNEPNSYQPTAPLITYSSKQKTKTNDVPLEEDERNITLDSTYSIAINPLPTITNTSTQIETIDSISTAEFPVEEFASNNIVFVLDISSSMLADDKMDLMKKSLSKLFNQMRGIDNVAIVSFSSGAELILPFSKGNNYSLTDSIIQSLKAKGSTNISAGFDLGVGTLMQHYIDNGNNQIFIVTDGGFDMPEKSLEKLNEDSREKNFTIVGIGDNNLSQKTLQKLSAKLNAGYVKIKNKSQQNALLEEVKSKSKRS